MNPVLWRVDFQLEGAVLPRLEALLSSCGYDAFEVQDSDTFAGAEGAIPAGELRVVLYPKGEADAQVLVGRAKEIFPRMLTNAAPFDDQLWTEVWKRFIPTAVIRDKLVFRPPFRDSPRPELPEMVIDPGLAFGTGSHETTRLACGLALDVLGENPGLEIAADIGCGTAVLAGALVLCGCSRVDACDVDAEAIIVAREVLTENGLIESVSLSVGSADGMRRQYPLVIANILADKLLMIADGLYSVLEPGGTLVLSGILASEVSEFLEEFSAKCPVELVKQEADGEWAALRLLHVS